MLTSNILDYIPQRPPFVFIDGIIALHEDDSFTTSYTVQKNTPLSRGNLLGEAGLVEFLAQSIAAHIGYTTTGEVQIGVIGAIRNFEILELPKNGETITGELRIVSKIFNVTLVQAKIMNDGKEIASGELKVAL